MTTASPRRPWKKWIVRLALAGTAVGLVALGVEWGCERRDEALVSAHSFADVDGRRVRYDYEKGLEGAPSVVLITGMNDMLEQWGAVSRSLRGKAHVLTYDRSGMGFSDPVSGTSSPAVQAAEVLHLADQLELPRPRWFVVYSSSGLLGRELGEHHRDQIDGLVFIDPYMPEALIEEGPELARRTIRGNQRYMVKEFLKTVSGFSRLRAALGKSRTSSVGLSAEEAAIQRAALLRTPHWLACFGILFEWSDEPGPPLEAGRWGSLPLALLSTAQGAADRRAHAALAAQSSAGRFERLDGVEHVSLARENSAVTAAFLERVILR